MYAKKTTREGIASIKVENKLLCTQSKGECIFKVDGLDLEEDMFDGFYWKGIWIFNGLNNNVYVLKNKSLEKMLNDKAVSNLDRENGMLLLSFDSNGLGYKRSLLELQDFHEVTMNPDWIEMWQILLKKTVVYYSYSKIEIACVDLVDNTPLWKVSLPELLKRQPFFNLNNNWEINHFIDVVDQVLWLDITNRGVGGLILGLDINSGQILYLLNETHPLIGILDSYLLRFSGLLPFRLYSKYDEKRKVIFGVNEFLYWEVDITKEKPIIYTRSVRAVLEPLKATLHTSYEDCGITDKYIFGITAGMGDMLTSQVYALNRETFEVDWRYTFDEPSRSFPVKAEVSDTHLFVLDNGGILHIFEKEEIV